MYTLSILFFSPLPLCGLDRRHFPGLGFAIAAALVHPEKRVFCIEGDSAFGFSGMELETACRLRLPILFVIVNNGGIYSGLDKDSYEQVSSSDEPLLHVPPTSLAPAIRYDEMAKAFGALSFLACTPRELSTALGACFAETSRPSLINVVIDPFSQRKAQDFTWLTRTDASGPAAKL